MIKETYSQHLGDLSELLLVMPLKRGFVPSLVNMTYASRVRILLRTLNKIRKVSIEQSAEKPFTGPVEALSIIDNVRWSILENDTKLMMAVSFRGAWEPYIQKIAREAGCVLDTILCACEGYDDYASDKGFPQFASWARKHQVATDYFFGALYDTTVEDLSYLKDQDEDQRQSTSPNLLQANSMTRNSKALLQKKLHPKASTEALVSQGVRTLKVMHELAAHFPDPVNEDPHLPPTNATDGVFLRRLCRATLRNLSEYLIGDKSPEDPKLEAAIPKIVEHFETQVNWLSQYPDKKAGGSAEMAGSIRQPDTVQALSLPQKTGDNFEPTHACLLLFNLASLPDIPEFLTYLQTQLTTYSQTPASDTPRLTLALTFQGLKTCGLPAEKLKNFPSEFREGMAARAPLLGDLRYNHPVNWRLPNMLNGSSLQQVKIETIDLVLHLAITSEENENDATWNDSHPLYHFTNNTLLSNPLYKECLVAVEALRGRSHTNSNGEKYPVGHLGVRDGISQPKLASEENQADPDITEVGEFILGYKNRNEDPIPEYDPLFFNSSFMVVRALKQNIVALRTFLDSAAASTGASQTTILEKMVGRGIDGKDLILGSTTNNFDFREDSTGARCPFHSHIRRANPRTSHCTDVSPRILRKGMSYGPAVTEDELSAKTDTHDRGLMFICLNASISQQFEVIQRWISGGNSSGALSSESDPLLGVPFQNKPRPFRFSEEEPGKVEHRHHNPDMNLAPENQKPTLFTELKWGTYLFVPSTVALENIISFAKQPGETNAISSELLAQAHDTIDKLQKLDKLQQFYPPTNPHEYASQKWLTLLEDFSIRASGLTSALWQVIRQDYGGVLKTPLGVLVGNEDHIMQVLRDHIHFSVATYGERMARTLGKGYLGMDIQNGNNQCPYAEESTIPNKIVAELSVSEAFQSAQVITGKIINTIKNSASAWPDLGKPTFLLKDIAEQVFGTLTTHWFGYVDDVNIKTGPKQPTAPTCPHEFLTVAKYIFNPLPTDHIENQAITSGNQLLNIARDYVEGTVSGTIATSLAQAIPDKDQFARTLTGLATGFIAPTFSSYLKVINQLLESGDFWRMQAQWLAQSEKNAQIAQTLFTHKLITCMRKTPSPSLIHRSATKDCTLGAVNIEIGDRIILGLESASQEESPVSDTSILFGGDYQKDTGSTGNATHACPGQDMALGAMLGMLTATMEIGDVQLTRPLTLEAK